MSFSFGSFALGVPAGTTRFAAGMTRGRIQGGAPYGVNYPSPFFDVAHTYLPATFKQLFRFCQYYALTNPYINAVIMKKSEYPITDLIIDHEDPEVVRKWTDYMHNIVRVRPFQIECGLDYHTFGTSIVSMSFPFQKYLTCPSCGFNEQARRIRNRWTYTSHEFRLNCPRCGSTDAAKPMDWYYQDASAVRPVRWDVQNVEASFNQITGDCTYFYTIPAPLRADIIIGKKEVVESTPQILLQAVRQEKGVIFPKSNLFVLKRATIAGQDRGWGIPEVLPVLKHAFQLQVMSKAQESLLLEHIVPLRTMFPQAATGTSDPMTNVSLVNWRDQIAAEIARWRYDPNYIPILPLPIGTQSIGGDGRALLLGNEIQQVCEDIVYGMGSPLEFIKGGLSYSGSNVSLRMLENSFISYISGHRMMVTWMMERVAHFMSWPKVGIRFKPFKMADDLQRKAYWFQLNSAGKISDTTLLTDADLDITEENQIMIEESSRRMEATKVNQLAMASIQGEAQVIMAKMQARAQQAMAKAMEQPPAPGEPGAPQNAPLLPPAASGEGGYSQGIPDVMASPMHIGQDLGMSPEEAKGKGEPLGKLPVDLVQLAEGYASQIMMMPPEHQEMALSALQAQSAELYQLVKEFMSLMQKGEAGSGVVAPGGSTATAATGGIDQRPLPMQKPPRREAALV